MNNIFISYRRDDSADVVGRIYDYLESVMGRERIFKDVHSIKLGVDYSEAITKAIESCDVQLAVVGNQWLQGRRIDDVDDFVRLEIEAALRRDVTIIPVLVGGAQMPTEDELPDSLKPIVYRNAIKVRPDPDFITDMSRLTQSLEGIVSFDNPNAKRTRKALLWGALVLTLVVAFVCIAIFYKGPGTFLESATQVSDGPGTQQAGDTGANLENGPKVERSMEFVDRYHKNQQLVDARARLSGATSRGMDAISSVLKDQGLSEPELANAYSETILNMVATEQLESSLEQVFTFYEQVLLCRDMQLCDEKVASEFFDPDGKAFSRTFYPYICKIRADWNNPAAFERVTNFYLSRGHAELCQ